MAQVINNDAEMTDHVRRRIVQGHYPDGFIYGNLEIVVDRISGTDVTLSIYLVDPEERKRLVHAATVKTHEEDPVFLEAAKETFSTEEVFLIHWPYNMDGVVGQMGFPKTPTPYDSAIDELFDEDEKEDGSG